MLDYSFSDSSSDRHFIDPNNSGNLYHATSFWDSSDEELAEKDQFPADTQGYSKHMALRSSTAPARPLTALEEFRRSSDFLLLEHTVLCSSQLLHRSDSKFDLDSEEGQSVCRKFLDQLECMCEVYKASTNTREYRSEFSNAYQVLYREGQLCYLTEILDSAQESIPHLWVNGEKYVFSGEVLLAGEQLHLAFNRVQQALRELYSRVLEETACQVPLVLEEITLNLQKFDAFWAEFEHLYVLELMVIETDARRFITQAIGLERELLRLEAKAQTRGRVVLDCEEYNNKRRELVGVIGKLNSVANSEGRGRDDLHLGVLLAAEGLHRRVSAVQSKAVRSLSRCIRDSYSVLRLLFRKYDQNIEVVDPQLKNNPELVDALSSFESHWEKGKKYFLNSRRCTQLIFFSQQLEKLAGKYPSFREQAECRDTELFIAIPSLMLVLKLEERDKGLCRHFCPPLEQENHKLNLLYKKLRRSYNFGKLASCNPGEYQELFEKALLGLDLTNRENFVVKRFDNLDYTLHKIKILAIELQRFKPLQWNRFLNAALGE